MKKILLIILGCISLAMGVVGAIVPLLPAFPFLLLAAICFSKSSERLNNWFVNSKIYKDNLETYIKGKGLTKATKIRFTITITIVLAIGAYMSRSYFIIQILLLIVWIGHLYYFWKIVKTCDKC